MDRFKQISRLIEKGLFDERLKKKKEQKEKYLQIACLIVSLLIILAFTTLIRQLIPSSSIEISSKSEEEASAGQLTSGRRKIITTLSLPLSLKVDLPLMKKIFKETKSGTNILALGRPGQGYSGQNLTDTILLVHLNPDEESLTLVSLPRDLLVRIPYRDPSTGAFLESNETGLTKINSLYSLVGIEGLKEKIEKITGLSVDSYVLVDLVVVKEIIELVGGLNVFVPKDIDDPYFPGPNYTYQAFALKAGWRYLDGQTALKYIRTRYTSPNGDFDRMARQQQIIRLLKQKVLSLNPLWNFLTYLKIFNTLKGRIETDLSLLEMKSLWQTAQEVDINQITTIVIDKKRTNLLVGDQIMLGQQKASVVYPKTGQGNYDEIRDFIQQAVNSRQ